MVINIKDTSQTEGEKQQTMFQDPLIPLELSESAIGWNVTEILPGIDS